MKTKFGAIIVAGSGKINGNVASKNRAGSYLRTKVTPVNPRTSSQLEVRNRLAGLATGWSGLTQAQRDAWNGAVGSFAKTDIFGDLRNPSGFNLYLRINANLINIGEAAIDTPPTPEAISDITIGALSMAAGAGTISLAYTAGSVGSTIVVRATAPVSAGKNFVKSQFRQIGTFASNAASPFNAKTAYEAKFGSIAGQAGKKVFFETVAITDATGQAGVPQQTSTIIVA